ncbi:hypothetical protein Rctr197k_175 [Virus Rctr197k]|nr:hypothetical protein Rctr197k_175 [Virus Rctr197k]
MSSYADHRRQDPADGIHAIHRYVFANAANRAAFTNELSGNAYNAVAPTAEDIGAVALQQDDLTFWVLTDHSPLTWAFVGGAVSAYQLVSEKGVANGYASLDATGRVPASQMPAVALGGFNIVTTGPFTVIAGMPNALYVDAIPTTITLPAIATYGAFLLIIKDRTGLASPVVPITVNTTGGETVDGETGLLIDNAFASVTLMGAGSDWSIL